MALSFPVKVLQLIRYIYSNSNIYRFSVSYSSYKFSILFFYYLSFVQIESSASFISDPDYVLLVSLLRICVELLYKSQ